MGCWGDAGFFKWLGFDWWGVEARRQLECCVAEESRRGVVGRYRQPQRILTSTSPFPSLPLTEITFSSSIFFFIPFIFIIGICISCVIDKTCSVCITMVAFIASSDSLSISSTFFFFFQTRHQVAFLELSLETKNFGISSPPSFPPTGRRCLHSVAVKPPPPTTTKTTKTKTTKTKTKTTTTKTHFGPQQGFKLQHKGLHKHTHIHWSTPYL